MGATRIKSLHHNLKFQDPYIGGENVVFHRSHRSKKLRKDRKRFTIKKSSDYYRKIVKKIEKYDNGE